MRRLKKKGIERMGSDEVRDAKEWEGARGGGREREVAGGKQLGVVVYGKG